MTQNAWVKVPKGYAMVPILPTDEMVAAGERGWGDPDSGALATWAAMLAASPSSIVASNLYDLYELGSLGEYDNDKG